jgi:hypothetical protein
MHNVGRDFGDAIAELRMSKLDIQSIYLRSPFSSRVPLHSLSERERQLLHRYGSWMEALAKGIATVEPVFGNLRHNKRLNRFTLRGRHKVEGQWKLYYLVHNIEKLAKAGYGMKPK